MEKTTRQEFIKKLSSPKSIAMILALFILGIFPLVFGQPFAVHLLVLVLIFSIGAQAWNLLAGYCGQFSLGHAIFFGAGAYGMTLAFVVGGIDLFLGVAIGLGFSILLALAISLLSFRLRGVFFSMVTLSGAYIMYYLMGYYTHIEIEGRVVGGWYGFVLPRVLERVHVYYIALSLLVGTIVLTIFLEKSRFGHFMVAIREDEDLARSLGINSYRVKTFTAIISAIPTSLAGSLYALYLRYVTPLSFLQFAQSWNMMLGPMVGGLGTIWGPLIGTILMMPFSFAIQSFLGGAYVGLPQIITGVIIFVVVMFVPEGFIDLVKKRIRMDNGQTDKEE